MASSPFRSPLYRRAWGAVICVVLALTLARIAATQTARKTAKGPRALGLVQLAPSGKAHLIPIAILIDGKFYDASAYKADPVPFALDSEVVYEAVQTGISKGLFTVSGALHNQNNWIGEGTWQVAGSTPKKKVVKEEKPNLEDDSGPPVLRKSGSSRSNSPAPASPAPSAPAPAQPQPSSTAPAPSPAPASQPPTPSTPPSPQPSEAQQNDEDPNRPVLRRGSQPARKQSTAAQSAPSASRSAVLPPSPQGKNAKPGAIQLIPAISDAHGPEPRPYIFEMKPDEEQQYLSKLLALAAIEVQKKAREMTPVMPGAARRTPAATRPAKAPSPTFDDIEFRAFDLWNTNQPVFVISASAHLPASTASVMKEPHTYFITLVADADIYTELHMLLVEVTDQQHLDEFPRLELVDAVDADGDGRGELLFRQVSDAGTAWVIYRATADTLFPLFEGTPTKIAAIAP